MINKEMLEEVLENPMTVRIEIEVLDPNDSRKHLMNPWFRLKDENIVLFGSTPFGEPDNDSTVEIPYNRLDTVYVFDADGELIEILEGGE